MSVQGFTVWITGMSGSGKSTLARLVAERLEGMGRKAQVLDGAQVREKISEGLTFSERDRKRNTLRIGEVCRMMVNNGVAAVVAAESPYEESRAQNRKTIGRYIEVYLKCPLEVLEARDAKGIYARAKKGEIPDLAGVTSPYQEPARPEVICRTDRESPQKCAAKVIKTLQVLGYLPGGTGSAYTEEEEEQIKKHLKGMGYL